MEKSFFKARIVVILFEPQNPINIGSTIRACANAGITDLRIIRPRIWDLDQVLISAPRLVEFTEKTVRVVTTWEEAVDGLSRVYALTARSRSERHRRFRIHEAIDEIREKQPVGIGFVFGREDHGLPNKIIDRCSAYLSIETADHRSLNLAQAVMIVVYQCFLAFGEPVSLTPTNVQKNAASFDSLERMMSDAEKALDVISFFKGNQRENILRTLRRIFNKAELDTQELATFWGIWKSILRTKKSSE